MTYNCDKLFIFIFVELYTCACGRKHFLIIFCTNLCDGRNETKTTLKKRYGTRVGT